ncbi:MAG TPA: hypothetical protein PKO41_09005 [Dokdonella sp.]|uniref:hypothetical protein n=1 Tax=Dokdonella sp. TaxID=2291710 RepID=UPI0025BE9925|nr:hypothetical protein [Dokdonella sp.]MBX3692283.1 hypothetical protein [Dokdonella sp.]MCW5568465.1 hypothetical protein [Dokdonella sp.]HNR92550.1 hypothetical protein [Dokdonella sp.]
MNRIIHFRLLVALAITASISAFAWSATRPQASAIAASAPFETAPEAIPVLPTIVVNANDDVPVLPLVIVRPSAEERAMALELAAAADDSHGGGAGIVGELLPRARLDVPYYSFGKLIPGTSKD